MSVLNQKNLGACFAGSSSESLTWFFIQGEAVKNKKGEVTYKKKTEGEGKDKKEVSEEHLQITRTVDESGKQTLRLYHNTDLVAWFDFTKTGAGFFFSDKWDKPKCYIVMPVDPTFEIIIGNDISDVFDEWMTSDRFLEFLFRQSSKLKYRTLFTRAILLFLSYLEHRKVENSSDDKFIPAHGTVDMQAVAKTFALKLALLSNFSARTKDLFPIMPMLEAGKEVSTTESLPEQATIAQVVKSEETEPIDQVPSELVENEKTQPLPNIEVQAEKVHLTDPNTAMLDRIEAKAKAKNK